MFMKKTGGVSDAAHHRVKELFLQTRATISIWEIRCNISVLQQLFHVPKIATFLFFADAPPRSSPYVSHACILLQGTYASFHARMGAFCHVRKISAAGCRSPPRFLPLCSAKLTGGAAHG